MPVLPRQSQLSSICWHDLSHSLKWCCCTRQEVPKLGIFSLWMTSHLQQTWVLHSSVCLPPCRYTVCRTLAFDVAATALLGVSWDSKTLGLHLWHTSRPAVYRCCLIYCLACTKGLPGRLSHLARTSKNKSQCCWSTETGGSSIEAAQLSGLASPSMLRCCSGHGHSPHVMRFLEVFAPKMGQYSLCSTTNYVT